MSDPLGERPASRRSTQTPQHELQDSSDPLQIRRWLDYVRSNPPSSSYYWRPVIKVAILLGAIFIGLVTIGSTS